jgi:hypothetical protein
MESEKTKKTAELLMSMSLDFLQAGISEETYANNLLHIAKSLKPDFDSEVETRKHIARVNEFLLLSVVELTKRAVVHDASKLTDAEKPFFDEETPKLKTLKFGSEDYYASLARLKPALDHHYSQNSHHPQFYENGIEGMDLFDLVEMLCDWKAAGERDAGGNILDSIKKNTDRFSITPQLATIFKNHAERYLSF